MDYKQFFALGGYITIIDPEGDRVYEVEELYLNFKQRMVAELQFNEGKPFIPTYTPPKDD